MNEIRIGRLLRSGTTGFVAGCHVNQILLPSFGALVRVPVLPDYDVYGLIYDMRIDDDGLVRQLVTTDVGGNEVYGAVIADNRINRNVPLEMGVLSVGYSLEGRIYHLLPPRPPLSLDLIYLCEQDELRKFSSAGRFGYFRHILRAKDLPISELLAAHFYQSSLAHRNAGNLQWRGDAARELITLLRDDYSTLMEVLNTFSDVFTYTATS